MTQEIHSKTLSNGLRVLLEPMPWLPSVSFNILLPFGATTDAEHVQGSSGVLSDWLLRGAGDKDAKTWSDALDDLGVRRGHNAGREYTTYSVSLLADTLPATLELYADMLQRPRLEDSEFASAQALALEELASLDDNPTQLMFMALIKAFFASSHAQSSYGTRAGLEALTAKGLREDFAARVGPQDVIISVAGGITWQELLPLVERTFGAWQADNTPRYPEVALQHDHYANTELVTHHLDASTSQVHIGVAFPALHPKDAHWYEQALAKSVLSGGMGSRLFSEVREKRGLVYTVYAATRTLRDFGYGIAYAGTTPERAQTTLEVLVNELRKLSEGISEDELERARVGILSNLVMQGEASSSRASSLARDTFIFGEPRPLATVKDAIQNVSLANVNAFLAARPNVGYTVTTFGPTLADSDLTDTQVPNTPSSAQDTVQGQDTAQGNAQST
jgi:predicted Zn-dependent peptidase